MKNLVLSFLNRILFITVCLSLIICADRSHYEYAVTTDTDDTVPAVTQLPEPKEPQFADLGIPALHSYGHDYFNARNPWDMVIADGVLFIGSGDYGLNPGGSCIYGYDIIGDEWTQAVEAETEAVLKFCDVNGVLYAPGIDPVSGGNVGNYYVYSDGVWKENVGLPDAVHNYDITSYNGALFFAIGTHKNAGVSPVKISCDNGISYADVPFFKDGNDIVEDSLTSYVRVYDFFEVGNKLYAATVIYRHDGKRDFAVYKYDHGVFEYYTGLSQSGISNEYIWQDVLGPNVTYGGKCFFTTGNLYMTDDMISFNEINTPDGGLVTDMLVEEGGSEEVLYILSAAQNDNGTHTSTIWRYNENSMTEVVSFTDTVGALSFAKYENNFFVGLGRSDATDERVGTIIKISL